MSRLPQSNQIRGAYLITGSAGIGKTTIAALLSAKGYNAVDADKAYGEWVDKDDGSVEWRNRDSSTETWLHSYRWVFNAAQLTSAIQAHAPDHLFICGIARNQHLFYHLFDKIFFLDADVKTVITRLESPSRDHDFGKEQHQQLRIREQFNSFVKEFKDSGAIFIDAEQAPEDIVASMLQQVTSQ